MPHWGLRVLVTFFAVWAIFASDAGITDASAAEHGFINRVHKNHRYVVFVPQGHPPAQGWPVVLFLHSAGERGTDGRMQVDLGIGPALQKRAESYASVVVFPQADFADGPILETWRAGEPGGELAMSVLADVESEWPIDPSRRAITGWSMGAYGALSLAAADPGHWSKVLAISGGGEPEWGEPLSKLPVWLVHGARDRIVPVSESREMAAAFPPPHERLTFSEVPAAAHDIAQSVYANVAVLDWLLADTSATPPRDPMTALVEPDDDQTDERTSDETDERPFTPALSISKAISLRLGNDALTTLGAGVPEAIRKRGIHGQLAPVEDEVEFRGRTFDINFHDMEYRGQLHRAILQGCGPDRLRVEFALQNFEVLIGEIEVSDGTDGMSAEQVSVIVGHREPVWMKLEVRPVVTDEGALRLDLLRSQFSIPDNNWYVKPPESISIRGDLFTKDIVRTAIVGGVYQRKTTIEGKLLDAVEPLLRQVEQRIDFTPLAGLVNALWPLPVYQPRVRVLLEEVATDRDGVSLVFECAAAGLKSVNGLATAVPHVDASSPAAYEMTKSTDLRAAVSVDVIEHLSAMMAGSQAVQLYAADVPGRPFDELDDVAAVAALVPSFSIAGEPVDIRSRFDLAEPFRIVPIENKADPASSVRLAIDVPRLTMTISGKGDASPSATAGQRNGEWTVLAERDLFIRQPIRLATRMDADGAGRLTVTWDDGTQIKPADADDEDADDESVLKNDELIARFRQGWTRWAQSQQDSVSKLPDVTIGSSLLQLDRFAWNGECLSAEFRPAETILANRTNRRVRYCIRSEHSRWSDELTLEPNTEHTYRTGCLLQVRGADQWSPSGQPLQPGTYDWSPQGGADGSRWVRRSVSTQPKVASSSVATSKANE